VLNIKDDYGCYPIHHTFLGPGPSQDGVIQYLMDIDPMSMRRQHDDRVGSSALHLACQKSFNIEAVAYMVRHPNVLINMKQSAGRTP
jgi:hypothetical protein